MLKNGHPNPLNVHNLRQLDWCPPHFTRVTISSTTNDKLIADWLYENLSGRFYIGVIDTANKFNYSKDIVNPRPVYTRYTVVAFEISSEASYFSLFCSELMKYKL